MTWALHEGDCLDPVAGLASLPDKSVDHVITDPPYDARTHSCNRRGGMDRERQGSARASISRTRTLGFEAMTGEQMMASASQFARLARRWVMVFCSVEMIADWRDALEAAGMDYVRTGIWHKVGGAPQFTGDRPAVGAEAIVITHHPGRKKWNGGGKQGVWEFPIVLNRGGNDPRLHTTQKPLALMAALVADFTDPGETILDPFAGSGTTGVACIRAGRNFIGWERDPKYAAVARRRLGETREQGVLSLARAPKAKQGSLL